MPIYPIINKKTKEQKEISLSIEEWENFKKENKEWVRDWSDPSSSPGFFETGDWRNKLTSKHPSWNDVLGRAQKMPGSTVKKL